MHLHFYQITKTWSNDGGSISSCRSTTLGTAKKKARYANTFSNWIIFNKLKKTKVGLNCWTFGSLTVATHGHNCYCNLKPKHPAYYLPKNQPNVWLLRLKLTIILSAHNKQNCKPTCTITKHFQKPWANRMSHEVQGSLIHHNSTK